MHDAGGLRVSGLRKHFGDVRALDGVDLSVPRGELVGFLGPNGAGKTTTMRGILGLIAMDAGSVEWDDRPMTTDDRRSIGYMPQERGLYPRMKVHEHVAYIGRLAGLDADLSDRRAGAWIERVGLIDRRDDLIQELSTGNQQRAQLAMALVHEPKLLVLDEPFAGLDPVAVAMLSELMAEQTDRGASVVFSSHQLDLVQDLAREVTIVAAGSTRATGSVAELRHRSPTRVLTARWATGAEVTEWSPPAGRLLRSVADGSSVEAVWEVPSDVDVADLLRRLAATPSVMSMTFEPPGLESVFLELVEQ